MIESRIDHICLNVRNLDEAMIHVKSCDVEIIDGPVSRTGANGALLSFYFRDPSDNIVEVANDYGVEARPLS